MENRQAGDAIASQARISVAARSSKRTATTLRTIRHATMVGPLIMPQRRRMAGAESLQIVLRPPSYKFDHSPITDWSFTVIEDVQAANE